MCVCVCIVCKVWNRFVFVISVLFINVRISSDNRGKEKGNPIFFVITSTR